ncbi:EAL domain-containing protein [Aeromonas hydrophila]|uniref:EAL domain-containing protein n=1 Tax=Aeromonas hydrophila TaxID=644 RepID=UPI0009B927E8|nr:EAL domain-containing protein [Aeromonas hydrophila]
MMRCMVLSESISDKSLLSWNKINFSLKIQNIVSPFTDDVIGGEILIDFNDEITSEFMSYDSSNIYFMNGSALEYTLSYLYNQTYSLLNGRKIFVNVERMNLCNSIVLRKILSLSRKMSQGYNIELIIETTERNVCGACPRILTGLDFLRDKKISLAMDDYNIYNGDFRCNEINSGFYNYIKLEAPQTKHEINVLNKFIKSTHQNIIIEKIEDKDILERIDMKNVYGLQGYAFDYGKVITSSNM